MARTKSPKLKKTENSETQRADVFQLRKEYKPTPEDESKIHLLAPGIVCETDSRGHATPLGRSLHEIVVDASEGFIPLWANNVTLRWRFRESSMAQFANPEAAKNEIRNLFGESLVAWSSAAPVKFKEDKDVWDFEIVVRSSDNCNPSGCVLASTFFPDSGRHEFVIYPMMFTQIRKEQIDTFIHEIGHIFGLRHFFANVSETAWPSEIFGKHSKFSIMNYGSLSILTTKDKSDLKRLYEAARSGALTHINGTPIRLVKPFNTLASAPDGVFSLGQVQPSLQPQSGVTYLARK